MMKVAFRLTFSALLILLFVMLPGTGLAVTDPPTDPNPPAPVDSPASPTVDPNSLFQYDTIKDTLPRTRFDKSEDGTTKPFVDDPFFIISDILSLVNILLATLAFLGIVFSGMLYIMAADDPDKAKKARNNVIYIITGMLIYIVGYWFIYYAGKSVVDFFNQ